MLFTIYLAAIVAGLIFLVKALYYWNIWGPYDRDFRHCLIISAICIVVWIILHFVQFQ